MLDLRTALPCTHVTTSRTNAWRETRFAATSESFHIFCWSWWKRWELRYRDSWFVCSVCLKGWSCFLMMRHWSQAFVLMLAGPTFAFPNLCLGLWQESHLQILFRRTDLGKCKCCVAYKSESMVEEWHCCLVKVKQMYRVIYINHAPMLVTCFYLATRLSKWYQCYRYLLMKTGQSWDEILFGIRDSSKAHSLHCIMLNWSMSTCTFTTQRQWRPVCWTILCLKQMS